MSDYGVMPEGFVIKPYDTIATEIEEAFKQAWGADLDISPQGFVGQAVEKVTDPISELWQLAQAMWASLDPDVAEDASLQRHAAITGTLQRVPTQTQVYVICTGTPTTVLPAGQFISTEVSHERFLTKISYALATVSTWGSGQPHVLGDMLTTSSRIYVCTSLGSTSGVPAGTTIGTSYVSGSSTWLCVGAGTGAVNALFWSYYNGPSYVTPGQLTRLETFISGWANAMNAFDQTTLGETTETNEELRIRREQEIHATGKGVVEVIRTLLLETSGVTGARVLNNTTDYVDGNGVAAHGIMAIVQGGTDAAVGETLLDSVAGGTPTSGDETVVVQNDLNEDKTFHFQRPDEVEIYVAITGTITDDFPDDGVTQIKAILVAYGATQYTLGAPASAVVLSAQLIPIPNSAGTLTGGVEGITDLVLYVGTSPTPTGTSVTTTVLQIPVLDTSRITVVMT